MGAELSGAGNNLVFLYSSTEGISHTNIFYAQTVNYSYIKIVSFERLGIQFLRLSKNETSKLL